jgi:hypothetical protein
MQPCDLHITPIFQEDECNGERTLAQCVVDSSLYSELQLPANATQQQINQALYLAFLNLKSQLDAL